MGAVTFSLDNELLEHLREVLPLDVLVETGTFRGDTVANMAECFSELHSVELSQGLFEQASQRFAAQDHIHLRHGDSPEFLRGLRPRIAGRSALFWLDAHWCVQDAAEGETSQCPLLEELAAIGHLGDHSVVLIDDARMYLCPAPAPHETNQWPSLHEVLSALRALSDRHEVMVINDVIVFYPPTARGTLENYARQHGVDWLAVMDDKRECDDLQQQLKQVRDHVAVAKQAVVTHERAIEEQQQRLDNFRRAVAEDKQMIGQLRHTIETQRPTIEQQQQTSEQRRHAIEQQQQTIEQQRRTIEQLQQTNQKRSETIEGLRSSLQAAHETFDVQRERARQRDEAIARKHADFERIRTDLSEKVARLRDELQHRNGAGEQSSEAQPKGHRQTAVHMENATT